jgi:ribosomal protein S18 acetylase RimI-like enzyme
MIEFIPGDGKFADSASGLIHDTMGPFADAALGLGDHSFSLQVLRDLFARVGNRFSHDTSTLGIQSGQLAALLIAFPGSELWGRNWNFIRQSTSIYGVRKYPHLLINFILTFTSKETGKDEFYIAHLAVNPAFRKQGIARTLLQEVEKQAARAGLRKASLLVEIGNIPAITLYQTEGYTIIHTIETPKLEKRFHSPGYHRMVKKF